MMKSTALFATLITAFFATGACSQDGTPDTTNEPVSLDQKIGQMLNVGFRGTSLSDTNHIVRDINQYHLGSVTLFDYDVPKDTALRNIQSPDQVKTLISDLQEQAQTPLFVAVDQEGGQVARLKPERGFPSTVSAQYLGELNNSDSTRHYARQMARTLSELGFNLNFTPVVDLNTNPGNPVIGGLKRSFSADPQTVVKHASIYIQALHEQDIVTVLKHFPGHGSSEKDSHLVVVDVTETWSKEELIPYRKLINDGLIDMIMTAHIFNAQWDTTYPATLSKPVITGMLRDQLNFEGVIISDDLMMGAIRKEYGLETAVRQALLAGVDILTFGNNAIYDPEIVPKVNSIIHRLLEEGAISPERIDQSYQRIMALKKQRLR
ncbi:glycoside hydrolase family 3 protein [Fodinibius sediminis]|uniref:beta-N-acetylhexosaminidase n=1 Tax=Fodinibius sediminis TaxID=1214077 RepID=A0A521DGU3_9BACT|nr:glycoside hydrolase family 3 protein [Fodinibius sediminis]SMO70937.1 beta-N-acetylhexosaminidase [Fodinibius sediminis]